MAAFGGHRWSLLARLAPAVLLLAWASADASATCGDYVHIVPPGADAAVPLPAGSGDVSGKRPVNPQPPCHGGKCDRAPQQPDPSPPPTAPSGGQHHDAVLLAATQADPGAAGRFAADPPASPRDAASSIFHPPRS